MRPRSLWDRELGLTSMLRSEDLVNEDAIEKLDLYRRLEGHEGCVNCLKWNIGGSLLASGSDDTHVKLWDVEGNCKNTYVTSHTGNIFGVVFVPGMNDSYIMTCAADGNVILTNLETKEEVSKWSMRARVKRLASCIHLPRICWSVSEDRFVRMHDSRNPDADVKFKIGYTGKSIDVSEIQPHWIAVGSESTNVAIYDDRNTRRTLMELGPLDMRPQDPYYITHVSFAKKSNTLIANYGRGSTYIFDLDDSSQESVFCQDLDRIHELDMNTYECPADPPLSLSVQNTLDRVQSLFSDLHYAEAIAVVTDALKRRDLTATERAQLLLKRSTTLIARKREGDSYAAARDTVSASILLPLDPQPILRLITVLHTMEQVDICVEIISIFKTRFPDNIDELGAIEESLSTLFSAPNRRTRNLRANGNKKRDYSKRYSGHVNESTDIKEVAFFGPNEEYIMAGSDSGHIFVYNRDDSSIITLLKPHPFLPLLASSGLDNDFLLFAPFNSSSMPHPPSQSNRIQYQDAEPILARLQTRNLVRDLVLLNRLGVVDGEERCQVS